MLGDLAPLTEHAPTTLDVPKLKHELGYVVVKLAGPWHAFVPIQIDHCTPPFAAHLPIDDIPPAGTQTLGNTACVRESAPLRQPGAAKADQTTGREAAFCGSVTHPSNFADSLNNGTHELVGHEAFKG